MILQKLFEPITIKELQIKNRIIMPAMHTNQGGMQEGISDDAVDFYVSRAMDILLAIRGIRVRMPP